MAVSLGHIETINILLRHGADVNAREAHTRCTTLHFAASDVRCVCAAIVAEL